MTDMGVWNSKAVERVLFFKKAERILEFISEISTEMTPEERKVMNRASEIITDYIERKMNGKDKL